MSQGILGNAQPTIFNRETVCRRTLGGFVQRGRTASRAVGSREAFLGKGHRETEPVSLIDDDMGVFFEVTSLHAVYTTGQSSGQRPPDAEDDAEPTVEDPIFGG
ncbi:hypothetical protein YC2023_060436 [Brassica napus]